MELWQLSCNHEGTSMQTKAKTMKKQDGKMEKPGSLMTYLPCHTRTIVIAFHFQFPQACFHSSLSKVSIRNMSSQFCVRQRNSQNKQTNKPNQPATYIPSLFFEKNTFLPSPRPSTLKLTSHESKLGPK